MKLGLEQVFCFLFFVFLLVVGVKVMAIGFGGIQGRKLYIYMRIYPSTFMEKTFKCFRLYFRSNNKIGENDGHYLFEHMEQF